MVFIMVSLSFVCIHLRHSRTTSSGESDGHFVCHIVKLFVVAMWVCKNALERHEFTIAGCICAQSLKHYAKMRNSSLLRLCYQLFCEHEDGTLIKRQVKMGWPGLWYVVLTYRFEIITFTNTKGMEFQGNDLCLCYMIDLRLKVDICMSCKYYSIKIQHVSLKHYRMVGWFCTNCLIVGEIVSVPFCPYGARWKSQSLAIVFQGGGKVEKVKVCYKAL